MQACLLYSDSPINKPQAMKQELINKVYTEAMKLRDSSLSEMEIKEKLLLMGFPSEVCQEAAEDVVFEREAAKLKKSKGRVILGGLLIVMGIIASVAVSFVNSSYLVVFGGMILTGVLILISGLLKKT